MGTEHPYRQDGNRPIYTDETEDEAIRALATRRLKLESVCLAIGFFASLVAIPLSFVWMDEVQALLGHAGVIGPRLLVFVVLVGGMKLIARALVRWRRRAWIDDAAARYGVPPDALEWVI